MKILDRQADRQTKRQIDGNNTQSNRNTKNAHARTYTNTLTFDMH